ncbi:unnamed protein product [Amoebophrya sp. A25]|nr:unnamed protein product [Amoebophrya sp. A25]|eukprot:GSA25T00015649001.1
MFAVDGKRQRFWKFCPKDDSQKYVMEVEVSDKDGNALPGVDKQTIKISATKGQKGKMHSLGVEPAGGEEEDGGGEEGDGEAAQE